MNPSTFIGSSKASGPNSEIGGTDAGCNNQRKANNMDNDKLKVRCSQENSITYIVQ